MRTGRRLQTCHLERLGFDNFDARALLDGADAARNGVDTVEGTSEDEVFVLRQGSYAVCVEDRPNAVQALHVSRMRAASDPRGAAGLTGIRLVVDKPPGLVDDEECEYRRLLHCHPALTVYDDGGREKTACWTQLLSSLPPLADIAQYQQQYGRTTVKPSQERTLQGSRTAEQSLS